LFKSFCFLNLLMQTGLSQIYAPRPDALEEKSIKILPSVFFTTRSICLFSFNSLHAIHILKGIFFEDICKFYSPSSSTSSTFCTLKPSFAAADSLLTSIFQPVSLTARRAFCPSLPIASDSLSSGTTAIAVLSSSS